jgi:hypothetical protein
MSEPEVEWYINCIKTQLEEIDRLISEKILTNSIREIISFNINEIQINLYTIIRKLKKEDK